MNAPKRAIAGFLVAAAVVDAGAVLLTITAFHAVGRALFLARSIDWVEVLVPLVFAQIASALASVYWPQPAACSPRSGSRARVLDLALELDP